jgi:hypothetical protein
MTAKRIVKELRGWDRLGQGRPREACEYDTAELIEAMQDKMMAKAHTLDDCHATTAKRRLMPQR